MPTLQQLRYLVAVADAGHFRRAAEACHVTQPTLSAQLKELESKLGAVLIERSRGGVVVTPLGEQIIQHARTALREVEEIRTLSTLQSGSLNSTIKVGVVQSLGSYLLPILVPDLHKRHPQLKLYVREGLPKHLLDALGTGALDLLFFPLPIKEAEFETRPLFREPLSVVMPFDHPFAQEDTIAPSMLKGETIMALERGHRLYDQVEQICAQHGAVLSSEFEGTSLDTLRQMVAMGMGLSLLPALYVRSEVTSQELVLSRPFRGTAPSRTIGMVWRRSTAREAEYQDLGNEICDILGSRASELIMLG